MSKLCFVGQRNGICRAVFLDVIKDSSHSLGMTERWLNCHSEERSNEESFELLIVTLFGSEGYDGVFLGGDAGRDESRNKR